MTTAGQDVTGQRAAAGAAVQRASRILVARQDSQGWWSGRAVGDVTLEAEGLLVREVLEIRTAELTSAAAQQIRSMQQTDGRWTGGGESAAESAAGPGTTGDLSASVLAYLALRLAGDSPDAYHMAVAAGWIRDAGGIAAVGVTARTWLAIFGLTGWADVRVPAPEFIYLPVRYAASLHDWAAWSRQAVVALTIIGTLQPLRRLPFDLTELRTGSADRAAGDRRRRQRVPALNVAQTAALRRCGQWLIDWQQRSGLPAARRPRWPCSLIALHLLGYSPDHPVLASGLAWLESATTQPRLANGSARPVPWRQPPVLGTTLAVEALGESRLAADHPALVVAARWLLLQRIEGPADGPGIPSGPAPCGWSFGRDGYPMAADTAQVLLALSRVELPGLTGRPAIGHAVRWLTSMQGRDGDWSSSAAVTAQVVRALAKHGAPDARVIRRGVVWLLREQRLDGSWPGEDDAADLHATTTVLPALLVAGVRPAKPVIQAAVDWLLDQQNMDAGWAATVGQVRHAGRRPASDASATAQALTALLAAGGAETTDSVDLGADWLVRAQQADGGWTDGSDRQDRHDRGERAERGERGSVGDRPTGRNSPRRRGSLLPGLLLPLGALGRYVEARGGRDPGGDNLDLDGRAMLGDSAATEPLGSAGG